MPNTQTLPPNHYYHLSNSLKKGEVINTLSWKQNNYFKKKSDLQWLQLIHNQTPAEIYSDVFNLSKTDILSGNSITNYKQAIQCTKDAPIFIDEYIELARELIFEQVRLTINNKLPSRQRCIWLMDRDSVDAWKGLIERKNLQLVTIELVNGQPFKAFQGHIKRQPETVELTFQRAKNYWEQKESKDNKLIELLYEGEFKVIDCTKI